MPEFIEGDSAATGGAKISADTVTNEVSETVQCQRVKVQWGEDGQAVDVNKTNPMPTSEVVVVDDLSDTYGYYLNASAAGTFVAFRYAPGVTTKKAAWSTIAYTVDAVDKPLVLGFLLNPTMSGSWAAIGGGSEMEVNTGGTASGGKLVGGLSGPYANAGGTGRVGLSNGEIVAFQIEDIAGAGDLWFITSWVEGL